MDYTYQPLTGDDGILPVTILPGNFDDEIRVKIWHVSLAQVATLLPKDDQRLSISALTETLPPGWTVTKTAFTERRIFTYTGPRDGSKRTSWKHPDETVDSSLYEKPRRQPSISGTSYEALSSAWGPEGHAEFIHIGDNMHLSVRENLVGALRHLRRTDQERTMWIDAICINQRDLAERNKQVARMGQIYTQAIQVVIWIGSATETCTTTITSLNTLETSENLFQTRCSRFGAFERRWIAREVPGADTERHAQAFVQRLVLPLVIGWSNFENVLCILIFASSCQRLLEDEDGLETVVRRAIMLACARTDCRHGSSLFRLMFFVARGKLCTEPRDRLYGVLGLVSPSFRTELPSPRYDVPVGTVYRDATIAYIRHYQRLEILQLCGLTSGIPDLSSWVPDFSAGCAIEVAPNYFSCGFSRCRVKFLSDSNKLKATGVKCGVVERVSGLIPDDVDAAAEATKIFLPGAQDLHTAPPYVTGESFRSAYVKALWADLENTNDVEECLEYYIARPDSTTGIVEALILSRICYVYGLTRGEPLLGPLPEPWRLVYSYVSHQKYIFYNTNTNTFSDEDPRLEPLGEEWERIEKKWTADDPEFLLYYRNKVTGEEMNSDPRMSPEALRARGVNLEDIILV
ncbi:heterokaryon incompatibility protein-domain-containing protein [Podospora fimiseda]|uniref:Heterokaryon incompatibility protein-domain-containing protein n=1 Tax=Podospora fimiseda TaxID=252190 RepID=A0AAN6YU22_9PEZI|nr:heterokaryon incompatibility protein-domain-containing protein [Podospora fimiseda]